MRRRRGAIRRLRRSCSTAAAHSNWSARRQWRAVPQLVIPAVHVEGAHVGLSLLAGFGRDRMLLRAAIDLDLKVKVVG